MKRDLSGAVKREAAPAAEQPRKPVYLAHSSELDRVLDGFKPEPKAEIAAFERPTARFHEFLGPTPFDLRKTGDIIAMLTRQTCACGSITTSFSFLGRRNERSGIVGCGQNESIPRDLIKEIKTADERVPFCSTCLTATEPMRASVSSPSEEVGLTSMLAEETRTP